jgi:hypothetical protein
MPIFTSIGVALGASAAAAATVGSAVVGTAAVAATGISSFLGASRREKTEERRFEATTAARRRAEAAQLRRDKLVAARGRQRAAAEKRRFAGQAVQLGITRGAAGTIGAQGSTLPGALGSLQQQLASGTAFGVQAGALGAEVRTAFSQIAIEQGRPGKGASALETGFAFAGSVISDENVRTIASFFGGSRNSKTIDVWGGGPSGTAEGLDDF